MRVTCAAGVAQAETRERYAAEVREKPRGVTSIISMLCPNGEVLASQPLRVFRTKLKPCCQWLMVHKPELIPIYHLENNGFN